ncbi:hypothetical protein HD806DRAFT_540735 [Xylariaceae sp. AK1471]|nr:hypothetical protein HD806DRAFT_540735 [Xylariaceae sp. AK1471]
MACRDTAAIRHRWAHATIDDDKNGILFRRDLHWLFDASHIVFAPKPQDDSQPPVFLVHVFQSSAAAELLQLYHNLALQPLRSISIPFMFARFSFSIFKNSIMLPPGSEE